MLSTLEIDVVKLNISKVAPNEPLHEKIGCL